MDRETTAAPAPAWRRVAAFAYDALLAAAVAFVATFAILPLTGGEAILPGTGGLAALAYRAFLGVLVFAYFGLGWTRGGQTLGMRAWRIRLETVDGGAVGWPAAAVRFALGAALVALAATAALYLSEPGWSPRDAVAVLLAFPAIANLARASRARGGRSFQDLAGGLRVTRAG